MLDITKLLNNNKKLNITDELKSPQLLGIELKICQLWTAVNILNYDDAKEVKAREIIKKTHSVTELDNNTTKTTRMHKTVTMTHQQQGLISPYPEKHHLRDKSI